MQIVRVKKAGVCHVRVELVSMRHSLVVVSLRELLGDRQFIVKNHHFHICVDFLVTFLVFIILRCYRDGVVFHLHENSRHRH